MAIVGEGSSTHEYFGSSSAGSFTAQIKRAIDSRLCQSDTPKQGDGNTAIPPPINDQVSHNTGLDQAPATSYVLPLRRQADELVKLYWLYVDPLYPFIDKNQWEYDYNSVFVEQRVMQNERLFLSTLNVIFALSTQLLESITETERESCSKSFFQRAQALLSTNLWELGSLELVQNLLLTSQYLQSTNNSQQTWMVVGSAIRNAQSIGLHLPQTSWGFSDNHQRELKRRVWYGCVLMDRMVSVTHGRPAMISQYDATNVPLPIASPIEMNKRQDTAAEIKSDHISFFIESVRLYEIIHRVVLAFYRGKPSKERQNEHADDLDVVIQLDRSLSKWELNLPDHLQWGKLSSTVDEVVRRQLIILRVRFFHARILLLRPVFSRFYLSSSPPGQVKTSNDTLENRIVEQSATFCVTTAENIIALLDEYQTFDGTVGLLPAWWYRVYYLYTAATILITARLQPEVFDITVLAQSWRKAMSLLKMHERFGPSARRCVTALHILSSKMLEVAPRDAEISGRTCESSSTLENNDEILATPLPSSDTGDSSILRLQASRNLSLTDDLAPPTADLKGLDLAEFDFDINDLSWLNDMHTAWGLLNE
ncbi:hypothetical protein N7462_007686 [Penicillium macrosclerotiorum]|uniref:uncharacterized protein n=1 Tax=Penicillium macrosclerotiorum TaxID=303699 RepID=UPI0025466444|nr:uncharacterized protein N7462_007686 [Penicillium macrosclerotiorum]KAJ5679442.1 hypothetical protein N7462_007686 [Penicillium macrosclerotiorum]